jgi:YidC/Oxa1 family membrane protein insertase
MSYIIDLMISVMNAIEGVTHSWGLAIIGLTVLMRVALLPLTMMQARSTRAMAIIGPEQQRLQKKYKDDPELMNQKLMELYSEHKISPFSSCLGLALQFPILMAMIRSLGAHPALETATFLGLNLGSPPDPWWPLVLVAAGTTYLAMRFSPSMSAGAQQGSSQNVTMLVMLGLMAYFATKYASAVSLYIITANLVGVLERFVVYRGSGSGEGAGVKP